MSVTFSPSMAPIKGWNLECPCGATYREADDLFSSYDELLLVLQEQRVCRDLYEGCDEDCLPYDVYSKAVEEGDEAPQVNMANSNARSLLEVLGLCKDGDEWEDVCCGSLEAEDFLGRVLMAEAVAPISPERPTYQETNGRGPAIIMGGREEGYVQNRLASLREVAEFAQAQGRTVIWG